MLQKEQNSRRVPEILDIEGRIPKDHLLRKIDHAVDFSRIYAMVEDLYCKDNGRPGTDPVVLFKIVLLQHLYGIRSLRQTIADVDMNMAYRWFLGYNFSESVPHFATVSYNFVNRFSEDTVSQVFEWILCEVEKAGFLAPETVFIDGTHIKANANLKKQCKKAISVAARTYEAQLMEEINTDREAHGKKPFDENDKHDGGEIREIVASKTDPDCGLFHKGEHKKCFAYGAHTVCDKHNFILDVEIRPGNEHDSIVFDTVYDRITTRFPQIHIIAADAGYKTPWICKKVFDDGRLPSLPYKRPMGNKLGHTQWEYVYDEYNDFVICPEYKTMPYATTNREGYQEFKSKPYICKNCPTRHMCTQSAGCQKTFQQHVWWRYLDRAEDVRHSPEGKKSYALRSQTIERVFADAKEKHGMRYTQHRGLAQVTKWVRLKFAAMNLKKLAMWKWRTSAPTRATCIFRLFTCVSHNYCNNPCFC